MSDLTRDDLKEAAKTLASRMGDALETMNATSRRIRGYHPEWDAPAQVQSYSIALGVAVLMVLVALNLPAGSSGYLVVAILLAALLPFIAGVVGLLPPIKCLVGNLASDFNEWVTATYHGLKFRKYHKLLAEPDKVARKIMNDKSYLFSDMTRRDLETFAQYYDEAKAKEDKIKG